jgi:hypothetical protein
MRKMKKRCDKPTEKRWENKLENPAIKKSQSWAKHSSTASSTTITPTPTLRHMAATVHTIKAENRCPHQTRERCTDTRHHSAKFRWWTATSLTTTNSPFHPASRTLLPNPRLRKLCQWKEWTKVCSRPWTWAELSKVKNWIIVKSNQAELSLCIWYPLIDVSFCYPIDLAVLAMICNLS